MYVPLCSKAAADQEAGKFATKYHIIIFVNLTKTAFHKSSYIYKRFY